MEEEQRKKKLEAGKEKLAAFRKKKAKKRRKPTDDDASSQRSGNMADASSCSDVQSLTGDSDQGSLVSYSGEEWSGEEADMHSSVYYQTKLVDATRRVAELEEMMEGKQLALDKVVQENDQLRQQPKQQQTPDNVDKENNIAEGREGVAEPRVHLGDLHSALAQRDLIIQQLTSRLKATAEKSSHDYTQETQTLAHQVSLLQQQLQQAGETLRTQLNQHNVSAQALQEAKAEILALQSLLQEKEQVLAQLRQAKMEDPQRLEQREKELESSVHGFESKTKELEASVSQYEIRTQELVERYELREKELVLCVQQHEVREQELVLCVQQHEVREKELEVFVQQYASKEGTLQETVTMLETQLATAVSEREAVMSSLESGEQQKIAELTLQVQNLNQEKDKVVSELDQVKTRNVELEELCKQLEELQEECLLKQSENDELRNRINDQQGETLALKSQVEVLLQDGDQSSQDLDVLRDLLENKEQDQEMELQEKNAFILQLETDIKKLQNENSSYVSNIESLNSQILLLQADLNASVSESKSFKTLAERFKTELMKAGKDPESVSGDTVAEDGDDELDGSDVFAVESELEVRRISANDQRNVELKGFVMESVTLSESEVRKEFETEVSQRVLDEGVVRTENIQSLGSAFYSIDGGGSVTRTPETDSQIVTLNKEIALLKDVCKGHEEKVTHLLNDNSVLKTEVNNFKTQSAALEAKMGEIESQNGILVNQQQESYSVLQSLSSELQITCDKLKDSKHKYEHVSQQLSDHLEENAALVAKLSETGEEVKLIQHKLDESEKKLTALELESKQIKAELEGKCLEYENQLSEMQQTKIVPESAESREHDAEIQRLQKELEEAKAGLEEVCLGAERGAEALQNQCDRYAGEAAALQTELSQANKDLSQAREELSQAREEQSQAREDLSQANEDLSQANEDLSKVREELSQANEELSQSQERIVAFEHEQKELLAKTESLQQELTTTNVEFCHVRDMLEKGQEESKSLESDKDRYDDEVQSLKQKLDIARAELQQEQEKSISLQCEVSSMKKEMENVDEVMAKNKQEVTSLREQYDSQSEGFEKEKKQIIETLEMNLKESESQRDILSEEVASTTQRLHSALSEIGKVNLSLQQTEELTEQSLKELQDKCKSYEETIKTLQTETEHLHELEKQVVELKKEQELMKTDLDSRELQISNLRGEVEQRDVELCSVKEMSESKVREDQLQITQLQEELQKLQIELEESALKFASTQDTSEKVSTELNDTKSLLLTKQSELDQTVAKLQELTFGAEQSQVELQMKCADQAAEISKLGLDKERVMKELEKVVAEAETTRTALVTDIEKFRMEAGSLQTELQQVKLEHDNRLTEERHVRSEFKSQLDVASSETTQLQTALDKANKEVEETKCEMQKLRCEYEVQFEQYEKHVDDLKNQNRANKTEVEHLQRNSQCEEETKMELQNLIEHSMAEIKSLQDDKKLRKEELEDVQTKNQSLEEALYIEQAARVEVQSQYDSISSEFDRVNASEKKLKKDFVNHVQRIEFLITLTNLNNENIQHVDVSNIGTGLGLLEEYLNRMKVYLEEQTAIQEGLTEKVTCLEASNTELNHWISSLSGSEEALKTAVEDLKEHLEQAEVQGSSALAEMKSCQQRVETLQEEKEILKANFDSCMVDMQQKLSEQDMRTRKLQGEMMETAKEKDRDINETKMMYDAHISQLEEKQLVVEAELARAKKIISESTDTKSSDLETYENKVSEMEESISRLEFEKTKLQDQLAKCGENFQQEKEEIKSIFESQITELEENCKALESTMFRLKDQLSDAAKAHEQEKEDIEKNFDMQLSEWEDRCRIFEMDNGKLKRQMDEMDKDFKSEKEEMEKMYERQLIDLEDRCSQSELTANKSKRNMADISVDFDDAKVSYQIQVQELEERCVELEKSRLEVQERLELVSESAQQERKSLQGSMSSQISDIQKHYTVLETEYAALKDVFEQTQISHKDEVDQLKLDYQRKMAGLEQPSVQMVQESLQVETAFSGKEEIQSLRTNTEVYKLEIDRLTKEKEDIQTELEVEREHVKEVTQKLENVNTNHKRETENYRMQIESMASGEGSEAVKENMDRMRSEIDKLTLEIASSKQDMKKEKQKLKAAKLAGEKSKKEAQMMKASSDQEVQSLKLRLEAWEVELIQRRKFVEQDQTGVDSEGAGSDAGSKRQAELETLVKNYERKVDDLTRKLKQHETDPRQLNVVQGSTEPRQEGFEALEEPPFTDAFEPEPLTPDMLQNQPRFPSDGGYIPKETVVPIMQGFQPELEGHGEGFVPEAVHPLSHNLTLNMPKEQQANVQTESHSAQPNDNLTSGDGFQPEVDDSKTDTFQPEAAGEFKPDHIQSKTHLTLSTLPQLSTLTTEAKSSANTTGTQTEASDLLSPSTTELDTHGPTLTSSASDSSMSEDLQLMKRQHEHEKDLLEEEYSRKMKSLEVELQHKHQTAMEEYQKSVDQKMQQDLSIRTQKKHQEFIMELRKARKKLEAKHKSEVEKVKHEMSSRLEAAVVEQSESELLKQLHKENQELAEARDALLQEISQNQQSREEQESWQTKPEIKTSSPKADQSTDESQRDSSDRHQSDRFLEELESLSQRSGSELPLEWEMAMSVEDGVFDRELDGDGYCARHECLEMKQRYQRLLELYQRAQGDTESVFIVEHSPERNPSSSLGRRSRIDSSEQGSENTGSSYPRHEGVDTSQEVSEGDFEDSFKDRIQKLEAENIALEKKLCDQLEKFSVEKHHLEKRCEHLQINLNNTAFSRQEVEDKLVQQNEILQSSLSQLRTEFKSPIDEEILEEVVDQSTCAFGMASVQTQTEISGDTLVTILNEQIEASQGSFVGENDSADDILEKTLSAKKEGESCNPDARMSTPKSEKKNVRTELSFTDSEAGTSGFEQPGISSASSPGDSFLLPSIDHMESMIFSDSRSSLSPTSRGRKKKEPPIEISFNTTSVVSMKSTEGGTSVNQEQIEITGTVKSAGTIVPEDYAKVALEIHHTELVEEITRLKRDLHETKAMYARENALLQEQVEREKIARQLWLEKRVPDDQLIKELPLQTDVIELRQEVALLKENNKMVMSDNKHLMEQVREKECVLLHFRDKYDLQAIEPEEFSHGSDTQLLIIQKQRDELLEELKDFHSEHERLLSVLDARTVMEETLRREKEMLLEKLVQHEDVQNISTQKHLELEFIRGEQRRLEQLLLLKDENEQQLLKQKRILEGELYDIEGRLREREAFLEEEKHRLLREVKEKNLTIMKLETMTGGSTDGHSGHGARRASTGHVPSGTKSGVSSSLVASDTPYDEAIEILREKLKLEYEVKEAVIQEQHAGQTAAFWQQQNKKLESLRVQHESQMAALQGELDAERDRGSQQDLQLQEQHQQSVARLRGELAEEKAALLDTVLTQISELTHRQIQQAKHANQDEVELQVKAVKVAMEQIHTSQLNLVRSELEAEHAAHISCLRKTLTKEQLASVETTLHSHSQTDPGATSSLGSMDERLTQRYEHLVQRINEQLELQVLRDLEEASPGGDPRDLSDPSTSEAIRNLLESQREEISQLRSQMLSEYEMMLQARTQGVTSQSEQVTVLQREMEALQSQYEDQVRTFQEKLALTSESDKEKIRTQEQQTKELESLRTYYEKHVQDIEKTYSDEITDLRTKYETQISNMLTSTDRDSENLSDSREFEKLAKEREYVQRTTMLTVITDSDESSATESPRGANKSVSRLSDLERLVQERDVKISDLEKLLEEEKGRSRESAEEVKSLKDQLNEQEKRISDLNSELSEKVKAVLELQNVVSDKEKDILELQCVVSDREKDVEDIKTVVSDKEKVIEGLEGVVAEKEKLLQNIEDEKEKYLSELQEKDIRSDDSSSVDYSQEKHELITKLEELEHSHKQELESLRHDLEHDTQVEIETLQSEFKVQLEIELKRQAAELQTIHEENVKNLEFSQQVSGFGRIVSREVTSVVSREVTSVDTNVQLEQTVSVDTGDSDLSSSEGISSGATAVAVDVVNAVPVDVDDVDVVDAVPVEDMVDADAEVRIQLESKIKSLEAELERLQSERDELCQKHHQDIESLQSQLDEERERYDKLVSEMDDEEVLKDKYDQQLELSKQLMQQEFTETLESERTRFMERHRKMMDNFMADRTQEAEELKAKQEAELQQLKDQLISRDAEVARLTSQHAEELETVTRLQTEADAENSDDERKRRDGEKDESDGGKERQTELTERHKGEMEEVENKWKKQLEELKAAHEDELSAAALDTEAVKAELETAHQRELQDLETRLSRSHQTEMEDLCSEHQHKMDQLLRQQNDQSRVQHQESLDQDDHDEGLREAMREVSEVVLPAQTTPLLSATDLDSTLESEVSGAEGDHLMKSTPRDPGSEAGGSRGSTPDEMLATRSFAEVVRGIPPIVSEEEMREKEERIHQLEEEVRTLRARLESEESEEQLLTGRRAREAEEEGNLVMMLRGDLDRISAERDAVQNANDRLLQVLTDSVKNYVSVEDIINKKLTRLVNQSGSRSRPSSGTSREDGRGTDADGHRESRGHEFGARAPSPRSDRADTSQDSTALEETSILSNNTDEGLDLSQRLTESIFTGPELDAEGEEILSDARGRLQTSVNSLLEMIEKTTQQLMEAKHTQQELVETLASRSTEAEVLQARCTDIDDRLREEVAAKEYLSLELHKAEGLISGYATERDGLEQRLECLEEQRQGLALDLETTRNKLQEFQNAHHEIQSRQESVDRQEQILRENVGQETQALLLEVTSLTVDKQELEKQTKHQLDRSQSRINELEHGVEEMERLHEQGLERKREEIEDLRLQLDSVERQLKASKQFLAEQSGEREQEREDYQREVERLQEMLQDRDKRQSAQGRLQREVQDLSEQLQDRLAVEGELDEQTRRLRLVLQDKELTASELKEWVTQLEKEVDERAALEHVLKQKIVRLEKQLSLRPVPDETSDSSLNSTAEQPLPKPDLMSPDRRSPLRRQITLEEELEKTRKTGEELALEKDVLQQQVREQLLQISALRNQLDDMRHYGGEAPTATHASQLRERLAVERESLEMKEEEVTSLQEQKDGLKQKLQEKETELQRLRAELDESNHHASVDPALKAREENAHLKAEVEKLLGHQEDSVEVGLPRLTQDLLDEKNREIDDLSEQISQLQMALEATSIIDDSVRENDEMELLREELRQKAETISELQEKLSSVNRGSQFFGDMSLTDADRSLLESSFTEKTELQKDFDTVQSMLEEKEREIETLTRELTESRIPPEGATSELQDKYDAELLSLKKTIQAKVNIIEEKEEELYVLNEKLELQDTIGGELSTVRQQLADTEVTLDDVRLAKQNLEEEVKLLQQKLESSSVEFSHEDGQEKESSSVSISQLQEELSQKEEKLDSVRAEVEELKERLSEQQKELNDVRGKLQEKEVWLEEQQAGKEEEGQVERLQRRIVELEEEKKSIEEGQVEELRQKIEDLETRLRGRDASGIDGGEVVEEDAIVVDLIDEVEGVPAERDCSIEGDVDIANETRNIMEELNMKISELEEALHKKEELLARLSLENSEATPAKSDLSKQLSEKTQLYDQLLTDKIMLEQTVIDLETKLEEKQEYLENLDYDKNELSEKEELIAKLKQELKDKETDTSSGQIDSEESERLRDLQKEIEEKELKITELESQCAEQKQQLEMGGLHILQQQVQEKNLRIEELEAKYEDLKQQMREEAGKLEEEIQKIHQIQERQPDMGVLAETQQKVKEVTAELAKTREKLLAAETSLEQTLVQLAERDEQIKALFEKGQPRLDTSSQSQEEVNRALEDSQQEVYELSLELREKDEDLERLSTALTATEEELEIKSSRLRTVEEDHEKILKDLRETEEKLKQTSFELTNAQRDQLSTSLPLDLDEDHQLMTRSESEPALNNWRRESHLFRSRLHEVESLVRQQKQELGSKNKELSVVRKQLEQWLSQGHGDGDVKTHITSLQQEIQERDKKNQLLQAEIDELNETLLIRDTEIHAVRASESQRYSSAREATPPESEHQIRHLRHELRKAKSALAEIHHNGDFLDRTPEGSATEDDQSPLRLGEDARNLRREVAQLKEELQIFKTTASMSSRDFVKKVMELRQELSEEHKNHIRDIQERLKMDAESQLTTLQLRHEDEIKQLRQLHDRKMQAVLAEQRQDLEKQHKTEINRLIAEHKQEVDLVRDEGIVRDDASVTDLRQSLISDIQQTELMDNRLMEQLDGPGGEDSDTTSITDTASIEAAPPGAISTKLQVLLSRLHKKGVHVLTLSELQFLQRHMSHDHLKGDIDIDAVRQAWERERETLLSTINSLKDLLARVHKANNVDRCEGEEDWRGDLLAAVCGLFDKEREVVLAELRTYVVTHAPDADPSTRRLEQRISDQEVLHRSALDQLRHSDRQSMLSEMEALRKKASETRRQTDEQQREYSTTLSSLEDHNAKRERQQQRQIQVLEYKLQQEKVIQDDLKTSLDLERQRVREVSGELSREKNTSLEIQGELSTVQIQLSKARDALEREHNRFISVTDALEEERTKNSRLSELLESERRKCVLLNSQVIDLRSHNKDYLEKESRFVEQLRIELEREREKRVECSRQTEQERSAKHGVQQELEGERRKMRSVQTDCDALVAQLKLSLEAERGKVEDLSQNLDEERQTTTRLRTALELERTNHQEAASQDRGTIEDMEARLRSDQAQVEDLHRSLAREKQKVVSVSEMLETEREKTRQTLEHERAVNRQLKRDAEDLQVEKTELKRQVEFEGETIKTYQNQTEQLHEEVKVLKQRENEFQMRTDSQQAAVRKTVRDLERERDELKIKLHELELETDRLTDKVQDTQLQLDDVRGRELQTRHELDRLRLTTTTHHTTTSSDRPPAAAANVRTSVDGRPTLRKDNFDNLVQRLEFLALRMQDDVTLTPRQSRGDEVDAQVDTTSNYVTDIQAVLVDMKQLQQPLESSEVRASASAGQLANERIVQHNAELTSFLKRVCQEKEELRVTLDSMEEDVARLRRQGIHTQVRRNEEEEEDRYLQDRMSWASERLSLQMTLDTAEHEVERLQSEIRHVRGQLDSEGYLTEADRDKMQRLYGKFLRSESFRKALVYQKRYLLMLLGGYQDCEQETLMLIAQMGGYPSDIDARRRSRHSRLFGLFRSAARVIIAIARMRFMVRKWRRAIRVGSPVVSGRVNMNVGYMPSTYTHPQPATSPRYFPSMSRIPDLPRSSTSEPLLVLNGDVANPYRLTSSAGATRRQFTTPPTKDTSASHTSCDRTPSSSARRRLLQTNTSGTMSTYGRSHPMTRATTADESTDDFLHRLENLQTRLGSYTTGSSPTRTSAWR